MKLKLASILCAAAALFSLASCTEEPLGVSKLPTLSGEVVLTDVLATRGARVSPNYMLTSEFATADASKDGSGVVFEVKFASAATSLAAGKYTEASPAYAAPGNFVTGATGTKLYLDGKMHLVTAGTIDVSLEGETYTFSAIVKLDNGQNYSLKFTGASMTWTGFPELQKLSVVTTAQANQNKTVTVKLSDGKWGVEYLEANNWQPSYTGKGHYLAADFYSEDGYLNPGTYKPSADPNNPQKGEYVVGYEFDASQWGMGIMMFGTNWFTVDASATPAETSEKILTGDITVTLTGKVYTVTVDNGEIYAQFEGEIPALTKPEAPATPPVLRGEYPHLVGMSSQYDQYQSVIVQFASTDKVKSVNGALTGTGKVMNLTINAAKDGENLYIPTGVYTADANGAEKPLTWQATGGMDGSAWGMGYIYWGSYISDLEDGKSTVTELKDGTIWVGAKDGEYIFHINTQGQEYLIYQGKITGLATPADDDAGYVEPEPEGGEGEGGACGCDCDACKDCTGGGEGGGEDSFSGQILSTFISFSDYVAQSSGQTKLVGMELATQGITLTEKEYYGYKYFEVGGTGNVLKIEFYSADGKLEAGTYKACANQGAPGPGEFNYGFDVTQEYGGQTITSVYGSCWTTYADSKATAQDKITDGTATVAVSGDVYTITIESSVVNARYVGALK